ncbi:Aste57867_16518 [Aphanomyces stellatus]|uniref:Aste57867_16518 protein n=2 Tax=Aphanomyces stellatus TaxID=120398 RepID=A0A485L6F9_9STRA|nr:hypothetical protein As57867_016461 [Aphanomyces stellatus]VFT93292.1 Aste57867_16518 [Aphanomyces stellatus]
MVLVNTPDSTLAMMTASGQAMVYPQSLDDPFKSGSVSNVATNDACVAACQAKGNCAGVVYAGKTCTFYQPKASSFGGIAAGWVNKPVVNVDTGAVQYSSMALAALPKAYVKEMVPGIASTKDCAVAASQKKFTLFGYNQKTKVCNFYQPVTSTKALSLVNTPLVPVALSGSFGSDVAVKALAATSASDCYKLCIPSQNNCFGSVFDSAAKSCATYQAGFDAASTLGWVILKTLPDTMSTVNQVDFYITAHQDDHELFMSAPIYNSVKTQSTKSVFVYLSAGDAGQTDGWWRARETGTIEATKTWINLFGLYAPTQRTETVLVKGHNIQKVSVGNVMHYFIRLTEDSFGQVLSNQKRAPIDQPKEFYANSQALKDVVKAIIVAEATKIQKVTASYSKYLDDEGIDHYLHVGAGKMTAELLNADPLFKNCVSHQPYYGYQKWLDAVNMQDMELWAQRAVWANVGVGIMSQYPRNVWSEHSPALGRTYTSTAITKTTPCNF